MHQHEAATSGFPLELGGGQDRVGMCRENDLGLDEVIPELGRQPIADDDVVAQRLQVVADEQRRRRVAPLVIGVDQHGPRTRRCEQHVSELIQHHRYALWTTPPFTSSSGRRRTVSISSWYEKRSCPNVS